MFSFISVLVFLVGGIGGVVFSAFPQSSRFFGVFYILVFLFISLFLDLNGGEWWAFLLVGVAFSWLFFSLSTRLSESIRISFLSLVSDVLGKTYLFLLLAFSLFLASSFSLSTVISESFQSDAFDKTLSEMNASLLSSPNAEAQIAEQKALIEKSCQGNAECMKQANAEFEKGLQEAQTSSLALAKKQVEDALSPESLKASFASLPYISSLPPESQEGSILFLLVFFFFYPFLSLLAFLSAFLFYPLFVFFRVFQVISLHIRPVDQEYYL